MKDFYREEDRLTRSIKREEGRNNEKLCTKTFCAFVAFVVNILGKYHAPFWGVGQDLHSKA
jgi:hypothetical protein